jgi:hypothetical protein
MRWLDAITAIGCLKRSKIVDHPWFLGGRDLWESWGSWHHGKAHPAELRERAVAMVFEVRAETGTEHGAIARVGHRPGINTENLRNWVQKAEGGFRAAARHDE